VAGSGGSRRWGKDGEGRRRGMRLSGSADKANVMGEREVVADRC